MPGRVDDAPGSGIDLGRYTTLPMEVDELGRLLPQGHFARLADGEWGALAHPEGGAAPRAGDTVEAMLHTRRGESLVKEVWVLAVGYWPSRPGQISFIGMVDPAAIEDARAVRDALGPVWWDVVLREDLLPPWFEVAESIPPPASPPGAEIRPVTRKPSRRLVLVKSG